MKNISLILLTSIFVLFFSGCQKQISKEKLTEIKEKSLKIGIFSNVQNTIFMDDCFISSNKVFKIRRFHKDISHWNINDYLQEEIYSLLSKKHTNIEIIEKSLPMILLGEGTGYGKGVTSLYTIAKNKKFDVLIFIDNFSTNQAQTPGISFNRGINILTQNIIETESLHIVVQILTVEEKLKSIYFNPIHHKLHLLRKYPYEDKLELDFVNYVENDSFLEEEIKKTLKKEVIKSINKSGLMK